MKQDPYKKLIFQNEQKAYDPQMKEYYGQMIQNVVQDNNKNQQTNQRNAKFKFYSFASLKTTQIQQLQSVYKVKDITSQLMKNMRQDSYVVEMQLKDQVAFIKIILDHNFPLTAPLLYALQYLEHTLIDNKTWEINTKTFFNWNQQSVLLDVFQNLHNVFQRDPPQPDPFILEINFLKTKVVEDREIQKMKEKDLSQVFPNVKPEQYKDIIEGSQISEYIFRLPEYQTLAKYVVELVEANEKFSYDLIDRNARLTDQRQELKLLAQFFENQKNELLTKFEQCKLIKERFDKTKILSLLESEINHLDGQSREQLEGMHGSIQILDGPQDKVKFEKSMFQYLELRKKYHRLLIKKEKFAEVM